MRRVDQLYFAYGSNMASTQMEKRCPDSTLHGTGILKGYRFIINQRGYATIVVDAKSDVHGVVWKLSPNDEAELDRYEGHAKGLYDKCYRDIESKDGTVTAMLYIDHRNISWDSPDEEYLKRIVAGAEKHKLPDAYLQMLRSWPEKYLFRTFNRCINQVRAGEIPKRTSDQFLRNSLEIWLKEHKNEIFLDALNSGMFKSDDREGKEQELISFVQAQLMAHLKNLEVRQVEKDVIGVIALEQRREQLEKIRVEIDAGIPFNNPEAVGDIGTAGTIITTNPKRCNDADRVIITPHAQAIEWLWYSIQRANIGPDMRIFADITVAHPKDIEAVYLLHKILDATLAGSRMDCDL